MPLFIPEDYTAKLAPETMEQAITYLKEIFPDMLARRLRLRRVTAPLFVLSGTGINDDLNGVERAVSFPIRDLGDRRAEVVHSLAKWKRMKLGTYKIAPGYGLYTDTVSYTHLLLSASDAQQVLVFSRTKHGADKLAKILNRAGIRSCAIHGNKSQNARVKAMNDFKSGECRVMIATDIAARGIDIDQLPLVINYELPEVAETYVHRIGRTGRAGHEGAAWSFCSEDEFEYLCDIQKLTGLTILSLIHI